MLVLDVAACLQLRKYTHGSIIWITYLYVRNRNCCDSIRLLSWIQILLTCVCYVPSATLLMFLQWLELFQYWRIVCLTMVPVYSGIVYCLHMVAVPWLMSFCGGGIVWACLPSYSSVILCSMLLGVVMYPLPFLTHVYCSVCAWHMLIEDCLF